MLQPMDGPAIQDVIAVGPVTVLEVKVGGAAYAERKIVTLQPLNGKIYLYFGDDTGVAPSAAVIAAKGLVLFKNAKESYEASDSQKLYYLSVSGTTNVAVAERA